MDSVIRLQSRIVDLQQSLSRTWGQLITHLYEQAGAKEQGHIYEPVIQYDLAMIRSVWMSMQEVQFELDQLFCPGKTAGSYK